MYEKSSTDTRPLNYFNALGIVRDVLRGNQDIYLVNRGANTLDSARNIIDAYKPRRHLDYGTWGVMGIGMSYAISVSVISGSPVIAIEGDSIFGFNGMEIEAICRHSLPVTIVIFNNGDTYRGDGAGLSGTGAPSPADLLRHTGYDKLTDAFRGVSYNATTTDELCHILITGIQSRKLTIINMIIGPAAGTESGHTTKLSPK